MRRRECEIADFETLGQGPLDARFLAGIAGVIAGVAFNVALWIYAPDIYWMWWNMVGFLVAAGVSYIVCVFDPGRLSKDMSRYVLRGSDLLQEERRWWPVYAVLVLYFFLMLTLLLLL